MSHSEISVKNENDQNDAPKEQTATEQLATALKQVSVNTGVTTVAVASDAESDPEKEGDEEEESKDFDWVAAIPDRANITWLDIQKKRLRMIPEDALRGLDSCEEVCLRYNLIKDMSPVRFLNPETLVELDLYDNHLKAIDGVETLVNLQKLDLSYNNIRKIEKLENLTNLEYLYLCSNKISKIENLDTLTKLISLELGANRIRKIENLPDSPNLKELHLATNKISKIENLPKYEKLRVLTFQENRISEIENLEHINNLEEIYLGGNAFTEIKGLSSLAENLQILDFSVNRGLKSIGTGFHELVNLTDIWLNSCSIESWKDVDAALAPLKQLDVIYLEHNPVQEDVMYRKKLQLISPSLTQIDASLCK